MKFSPRTGIYRKKRKRIKRRRGHLNIRHQEEKWRRLCARLEACRRDLEKKEQEYEDFLLQWEEMEDERERERLEAEEERQAREFEAASTCDVCRTRMTSLGALSPRTLVDCGHTFCERCCLKIVQIVLRENPKSTKVPCPNCLQPSKIETVFGRQQIGMMHFRMINHLIKNRR